MSKCTSQLLFDSDRLAAELYRRSGLGGRSLRLRRRAGQTVCNLELVKTCDGTYDIRMPILSGAITGLPPSAGLRSHPYPSEGKSLTRRWEPTERLKLSLA